MSVRPLQRLPFSKKDDEWVAQNARYFSSVCTPAVDLRRVDILYRAANGEMDESDYLYVTNPLNTNVEKYKRFPSKIRNFDIISTNVMLLMGEKRRRGLGFTAAAINSNVQSEKKEMLATMANQYLIQEFVNEVIQQQINSGEQPNLEQAQQISQEDVKKRASSVQDRLAIQAQAAINYISEHTFLTSKFAEGFYHWIVTGRSFSYKEPYRGEVEFETVSPKEIKILMDSKTRFAEDAEAIVRYVRNPMTTVIDKFQGVKGFTPEIIKELESRLGSYSQQFTAKKFNGTTENDVDFNGVQGRARQELWNRIRGGESAVYSDEQGILVEHVVWTSFAKVGKLIVPDIFGNPIEELVDEDFKPQAGENIDWEWRQQKWHAYIIDDKYIVGGEPLYYTEEGVGKCKNPYNGRILNMKHVNPMSIVEKGLVYQIKYNIVHYYIEKIFAKNMDKIVILPLGLIPEDKNLGMDASMYYAQAMGFLFVDDSKKNFANAVNGIKVLDASLSQHIDKLYTYLTYIKNEWDSALGITPQRKGQMNASDGKSTTDNSVFRSSIMTEEHFTQFEELEETDLNSLLDVGKIAFMDGKKSMFIQGDDHLQTMLEIDPDSFCYEDYLIKIKNSGKNLQKLEQARANAQALTQNKDGRFSDVLKVINADNISELIEEMENVEANYEASQQAVQQSQQQQLQAAEQLKRDVAQINADASNYRADKIYNATIESSRIKAEAQLDLDKFNDPANSVAEIAALNKSSLDREKAQREFELANRKMDVEQDRTNKDAETKKYVADKNYEASKIKKTGA